jgi:hypothetical protein
MNSSLRRRPIDLAAGILAVDVCVEDDDEYSVRKKTALAVASSRRDPRPNERKMYSRRLVSRRARIGGLLCVFASSLWIFSVLVRNYTQPQHGQRRQQHWIAHDRSTLQHLPQGIRNNDNNYDRNLKHAVMSPTTVVFSYRTRRSSWSLVQIPLDDMMSSANSDTRSPDYGNLTTIVTLCSIHF